MPVEVHIIGFGRVGRRFAADMERAGDRIRERTGTLLVLASISDRSGCFAAPADLSAAVDAKGRGESLEKAGLSRVELWEALGPGSVVVESSDSADAAETTEKALAAGASVVLANKHALSGEREAFDRVMAAKRCGGGVVRASATVGAGLPVLDLLAQCHRAGIGVGGVRGSLSGTLAFVLEGLFGRGEGLGVVVEEARALGLCEPDPWEDLTGIDVVRKAVTLARVAGLADDPVAWTPFAERSAGLEGAERRLREGATGLAGRPVYGLTVDRGGVRVGLGAADAVLSGGHDQQSVVAIEFEGDGQPVVFRGPGAGIVPTARGLLRDVVAVVGGDSGHV